MREACFEMLSITNKYAQDFIAACEPVRTFPLPGEGDVFFYLATSDAVYRAQCREEALAGQRDPFIVPSDLSSRRGHWVACVTPNRQTKKAKDRRQPGRRHSALPPWSHLL